MTQISDITPQPAPAGVIDYRDQLPASVFIRWYQSGAASEPHYKCWICEQWVNEYDDRGYMDKQARKWCTPCLSKRREVLKPTVTPVIDPGYSDAKLTDYDFRLIKAAEQFPGNRMLLILGPSRSGKTRLCWAIVRAAAVRGYVVRYQFLPDMRQRWASDSDHRERIVQDWIETPILIMDDLSACSPTEGWKEVFHRILEARLVKDRPTIVTTAKDSPTLRKDYDNAIVERLIEMGKRGFVKLAARSKGKADW